MSNNTQNQRAVPKMIPYLRKLHAFINLLILRPKIYQKSLLAVAWASSPSDGKKQ